MIVFPFCATYKLPRRNKLHPLLIIAKDIDEAIKNAPKEIRVGKKRAVIYGIS